MMEDVVETPYVSSTIVRNHRYCPPCQQIPWETLIQEARENLVTGIDNPYGWSSRHIIYSSHSDFQAAALNFKCALCTILLRSVDDTPDNALGPHLPCFSVKVLLNFVAVGRMPGIEFPLHRAFFYRNGFQDDYRISTKHDHVLCTEIVHRDIQIDPLSYIARRIVKEWLERCTTTHQECSKGRHSDPLFPTRILRIGKKGDNQVHLVEPNGQRGKYVALSHCWGKERNFTTTLETLQSRKDGILISELPKTFQDAIKVVHEIGLQYLWIDSLCIIQDSQQDWEVESARMSYVYSNSHVTLAASRAVSDAQGFLQARTPETIIFEPTPGIVLNHGDRRQGPCEDVPFRKTPLCRRAWAVQERYLSRRTIFFDDSQTFWACQQVSATEDGQESYALRHRASISSLTRFMSPEKASSRIANPLNTDSQDVLPYWRWYAMVCSYMDCDITKKSDRLPALAGLATEIAMRTKEKYYAGLWEHGLIEGLAWQCFKRQPRDVPQYRAPSWSWASLETGLIFVAFQGHNKLASVVDVQVENLSCNPYGEVTGGSLVMDAHLQPVKAIARNDVSTKTRYWSLGMQIVDKWYWVTTVLDREEDHTKPLLVLFLAQTNDKCRVIALAVSPIEQNSNNYRRVGATWSDIKDAPNNPQVGYSVCGGIYLDIESLARERVTLV